MKNTRDTDFALLVHACDRYKFLYPGFSACFQKYWDFGIPCNYYFATEKDEAEVPGFRNILSGRGEWSDRLATILRTQITERYVIYLQEDMWLDAPVSARFFEALFELIEQNNWQQVKLTSADVYKTHPSQFEAEGFVIAEIDNQLSGFLMSHQITIWDREFLLAQLPKNEHPWRNERKGTKRLKKLNPPIFQVDYFAENGQPAINNNKPNIERSSYYTVSQNSLLNNRVLPYKKMFMADNDMHAYAIALQHHLNAGLTHDGKPKPRKDDIFKRIKNWVLKN